MTNAPPKDAESHRCEDAPHSDNNLLDRSVLISVRTAIEAGTFMEHWLALMQRAPKVLAPDVTPSEFEELHAAMRELLARSKL